MREFFSRDKDYCNCSGLMINYGAEAGLDNFLSLKLECGVIN
jgi:hypothetical protein